MNFVMLSKLNLYLWMRLKVSYKLQIYLILLYKKDRLILLKYNMTKFCCSIKCVINNNKIIDNNGFSPRCVLM